jgi:hypothetical protein
MADSNLFKPQTSTSGIGKKSTDKGQFSNPPEYPDVSGFSGSGVIRSTSGTAGTVEKTPGARKGRV